MIRRLMPAFVVLIFLTIAAAAQTPQAPQSKLKIGDVAPDFTLTDTAGTKVKLSDYRGKKNVVLAFYVLAFTGG